MTAGLVPCLRCNAVAGKIDALVSEMDFGGNKKVYKTLSFTCPQPLLEEQPMVYVMNVIDLNGNIAQSVANAQVMP